MVTVDKEHASILLDKSDGTFQKAVNYAAGASPSSATKASRLTLGFGPSEKDSGRVRRDALLIRDL